MTVEEYYEGLGVVHKPVDCMVCANILTEGMKEDRWIDFLFMAYS
jgi:hypothetical protein